VTVRGYGRAADPADARRIAVLEAWERWAGWLPHDVPVVRGSYWDLRDRAIDPRSLGTHGPDAVLRPGFALDRFRPTRDYDWVWAYSFGRDDAVLLPIDVAYYGRNRPTPRHRSFVYETSNGSAVGGCVEEAILHGLLEVAERDAFLLTWYARRGLPVLCQRESGGCRVTLFDMSVQQRVPCVLACATSDTGPAFACASAAHPSSLAAAAEHALTELGPFRHDLAARYPASRARARAMAQTPSLVRTMGDHALLYADPVAAARTSFLTGPSTPVAPADDMRNADLRDDVLALVARYAEAGMDVLVVDQTTPELAARELACVKVIVPGTLPMTFGHAYRRVHNLPRLRDHAGGPINPWPHPFP
ncbi:MAG TPA: YcaO-like family protein, partial [Pseudonocardiaceae bacterium]|nr:YcaO-like family protein [Pseudonocardiaceae bacterium]